MSDLPEKRLNIEDIFRIKNQVAALCEKAEETVELVRETLNPIYDYTVIEIDGRYGKGSYREPWDKKLNAVCWDYLQRIFNVRDYMLCTEYDKLQKQIRDLQLPEFTPENATSWIETRREFIYENAKKLIETVYEQAVGTVYFVGRTRKKRNNRGIDRNFIIHTCDYNFVFSYYDRPSFTDDFEKACFLVDGKRCPEYPHNVKSVARQEKTATVENEYFRVTFCKNGNTHFTMLDQSVLDKLNLVGSKRGIIGEDVKIKTF